MAKFEFVSRAHQKLYATPLGQELWRFMNKPISVKCMQVATQFGKPAILGIEEDLIEKFKIKEREQAAEDRMSEAEQKQYIQLKQMLGQMTRQVMEHNGYRQKASNVKTPGSKIFYSASTYTKI